MRNMYYIIANPHSGHGKGLEVLNQVTMYLTEHNISHKIYLSEYQEHTIALTQTALAEGANLIIAIGGDGTFSEIASAVQNREDVAIGFLPAGNGNDFAYSAGISTDIIKELEGILKNEATELDYIDANGMKSLNICGCGLDTEVLLDYNKKTKQTKFSYIVSLLKVLRHYKEYRLKINIDNLQTIEGEYLLVACCNGKRFGAKIKVCPTANLEDGLMDLVIINKVKRWKVPFLLLVFLMGKHLNKKWCKHVKCKNVVIQNYDGQDFYVNVDGQLTKSNVLNARIVPCKLLCLNQKV